MATSWFLDFLYCKDVWLIMFTSLRSIWLWQSSFWQLHHLNHLKQSRYEKKKADRHLKLLLHYYFDILCPFPWDDSQACLPHLGFVIIKTIHIFKIKSINFYLTKIMFRTTLFMKVLNVRNLIGEEGTAGGRHMLVLFWCIIYNSHLLMKSLSSCVERSWVYVAVDLAAPP